MARRGLPCVPCVLFSSLPRFDTPMKEIALTPAIEGLDPVQKRRNRTCTLMLTQSCNLHCSYCYEKHKTNRYMDFATARRCVEEQLEVVRAEDRFAWLMVELFGGEPLLNFPVIRELVSWSRARRHAVPMMFLIISNGTLLSEEIRAWFSLNKDMVSLALSYDGSAHLQQQQRGCASESALAFCHREWPDMSFRMTVTPDSLPTLAADIIAASAAGYSLRAQFASGLRWGPRDRAILETELRTLKAYYLSHPHVLPTLLPPLYSGGEDAETPCTQRCGAGVLKVCYDVDGSLYPCSMFSPVCAGKLALPLGDYQPQLEANHNDPACVSCPIKHACYTCPAANLIARGVAGLRDHGLCSIQLTQALVALEFQAEILVRKGLTPPSAALLKSLLRIHRKVKSTLQTK